MRPILAILGATGVGKSAVGVEVAKILNSAVISCDSMQIYKGMDIGTAKISKQEMRGVEHFMLDIVEASQSFSAYDYQSIVTSQILPMFEKANSVPILVGGTGFYYDSLIYGLDLPTPHDEQLRKHLTQLYAEHGLNRILEILKEKDIESYDRIDKNNPKRVIRAIEIAESGGSRFANSDKRKPRFKSLTCILSRNRQAIYNNINTRVESMRKNGLFEEVESIYRQLGCKRTFQSIEAIGYKEIIDHIEGRCSQNEAIEKIKQNTRHYAKRQLTYFKRLSNNIINADEFENTPKIADYIVKLYQNFEKN